MRVIWLIAFVPAAVVGVAGPAPQWLIGLAAAGFLGYTLDATVAGMVSRVDLQLPVRQG